MSEETDIATKVAGIIQVTLNVEASQVTPEAKIIEDLGADSLDVVELVMKLEEEFGSQIPDEDAEKLTTVGDVVQYVENTQS